MANGWTEERKAKQAALIQNWRPWDKSTGAKTKEGKATSAQNAFKGGWRQEFKELAAILKEQKDAMKLIR